jgi:hypothetical protein
MASRVQPLIVTSISGPNEGYISASLLSSFDAQENVSINNRTIIGCDFLYI